MVAKSGTPEAHEPAETILVSEHGLSEAVGSALDNMLNNPSAASILEVGK